MSDTDLERRLREALQREALQVSPRNRLDAIRARTQLPELHRRTRSPWLVPLGAAAAVALVAAVVWGSGVLPDGRQALPATTTGSSTAPPQPTTTGTSAPAPTGSTRPGTPSGTSTSPTATVLRAVPVYYAALEGGPDSRLALFREFVGMPQPERADPALAATQAAQLAVGRDYDSGTRERDLWPDVTVPSVAVSATRITVTLSGPGERTTDQRADRLAVQQLVWTVQAAVGKGNLPVRFRLADGGSDPLLGRFPLDRTYTRPAADRQYEDLAAIWVDAPGAGAVVPADKPVMATGSACVFDAALSWWLLRVDETGGGTTRVDRGSTTASSTCPVRGTWSLPLGTLPGGDYVLSVLATSPEDGSPLAEEQRSFTVR